MFTLDQLKCLRAVAETGSLSSASKKLRRAKSAVKHHLEGLEDLLDFELFDRSGYRLHLSAKGEQFLKRSKYLYDEAEELIAFAKGLSEKQESFLSVSASAIFPIELLASCLHATTTKFPDCEISFQREVLSGEQLLYGNKVDIAIFEELHSKDKLDATNLGSVYLPLVIGKNHPIANLLQSEQTLSRLKKYPQIVMRSTLTDPGQEINKSLDGKTRWMVNDLLTKKILIEQGLGWGRLPVHLVSEGLKEKKLICLKHLNLDDEVSMFIAKRRSKPLGVVGAYLWQLVCDRVKEDLFQKE